MNKISTPSIRRDLFEIENARNLSRDELVETFVATKAFWRLLSSKNHIVLGARGSGKTALAKMLSHDHLSHFNNERAKNIIAAKDFIGIFVPSSIEWVSGLNNKPWQTDREAEEYFQWRFNVSTCLAFLITLRSCLESYIDDIGKRAIVESNLIKTISESWTDGSVLLTTIRALQNYLEDTEYSMQQYLARKRALGSTEAVTVGIHFFSELFVPLRRAISLTSRFLDIPNTCTWILCLDEAEFLTESQHRIINTHMRSDSGNLTFKMTTMPYMHHTLQTNSGNPLNVGHDFEYVYIDIDPIYLSSYSAEEKTSFATTIFNKRMKLSKKLHRTITLGQLLGTSELLERKAEVSGDKFTNIMQAIQENCSAGTVARALQLFENRSKFSDQISRKIHSALLLRDSVALSKGRSELDLYSGDKMAIRCGDGNPRRLIRIFNSMLLELPDLGHVHFDKKTPILTKNKQTAILTNFSNSSLTRVQSEPRYGKQLYSFLQNIGNYMNYCLHDILLSTDQISSIYVDAKVTDQQWELIKIAVGLGLLFPNINHNNPDQMPERDGTFHLAYVLAPHFRILPRRGSTINLSTLLSNLRSVKTRSKSQQPKNDGQMKLQYDCNEA